MPTKIQGPGDPALSDHALSVFPVMSRATIRRQYTARRSPPVTHFYFRALLLFRYFSGFLRYCSVTLSIGYQHHQHICTIANSTRPYQHSWALLTGNLAGEKR